MQKEFENDIEACLSALKSGGLILYPTDTIWGIGCDATNADAVDKIFRLKKRADEKAMIILIASEKDVIKYAAHPHPGVIDHLKKQVRPTTVIYDGAIGLADNLTGKDGSIAMRICRDEFCKDLIKRFRKPIVSTSANISGQSSPKIFADIAGEIKSGVDYIVKYRQDDVTVAEPSSIIKWNKDGTIHVIR